MIRTLLRWTWYWRHWHLAVWTTRFIGGGRGVWWCTRCGGEVKAETTRLGGRRVTESTCAAYPTGRL